jgi:rhodanese-related sulfurtransferase
MKNVTFASLLLLLAMTACSQKPVLEQIDVHKAAALIQANNGLQIVDLRTPGEIAASGTIAGAQVMDFTASDFTKRIATLSKKQPVLLYCAAGGRSSSAAQILHQQQFLTVYDMTPGMNGWLAAGKKTMASKPR